MNKKLPDDLNNLSLLELFRFEAESQTAILTGGLLELERGPAAPQQLETLMRSAHSLKGAARIVNLQAAVLLAHAMEDCFVAAQNGQLQLRRREIDALLRGVDMLTQLSRSCEGNLAEWGAEHASDIRGVLDQIEGLLRGSGEGASPGGPPDGGGPLGGTAVEKPVAPSQPVSIRNYAAPEHAVRLTAENLNRLLGLAGESLVESRWLRPFSDSMQRLKRLHADLAETLDNLRGALENRTPLEHAEDYLAGALQINQECRHFLGGKLQELDLFDRRSAHLSHRLYLEVLRARMRPFGDGTRRFQRMVRDLARALGKEARLEIIGETTQVDRDLLERLETPLAQMLRNAVDHGCEPPAVRERVGKPREGVIQIEARHSAGMLLVTVSDDGPGIDLEKLRRAVVDKKLAAAPDIANCSETELLEFLFVPGLTLKDAVTEISGRGVGLDVVHNAVRSVRGTVRISTQPGRGARFQLQLPLTLSVLRALLVEVGGEPYAIPLARISRTLKLPCGMVQTVERRRFFILGDQQIGLTTAHHLLECGGAEPSGNEFAVVVLGERNARHGLIVDHFLGERELVVRPLDSRLGKVKDIYAAALMEDGSPVLIMDVEDMLTSINAGAGL